MCQTLCIKTTYCIYWTIRRTSSPRHPIWEENGGASYSLNVAYLAYGGGGQGGSGVGSQEAGAGSLLQEASSGRSGAMVQALGWEEGLSQQCEAREAGVESPLWHTAVLGRGV